jgi:hypothetical protein
MKSPINYLDYAVILAIIAICLLTGCSSNRIFRSDEMQVYVREYQQSSPTEIKARVEYYYAKTEKAEAKRDRENIKLDCQGWRITVLDRITFDQYGRIRSMSQFNLNNEFLIQGNTIGSILFGHFCVR